MKLALALTGQPLSGKSAHAEFLASEFGFHVFSGSDYLKQQAAKEGRQLQEREDYGAFQRELRQYTSASFMTDLFFELPHDLKVNVGIRNMCDVEEHLGRGGLLVALVCPLETRFARRDPNDPKYPETLEEFYKVEAAEYDDLDVTGQHTEWAIGHAQYEIDTTLPFSETSCMLAEIVKREAASHQD